MIVVGLLLLFTTVFCRALAAQHFCTGDLRMGISQTFQILSRFSIVLRKLLGSTDPVRLRAEEALISDGALGILGSLLPKIHGLVSVVTHNGLLILR